MSIVDEVFPEPGDAIELEPEDLAGGLLEALCQYEASRDGARMLHRVAFTGSEHVRAYAGKHLDQILRSITEAWIWLEREGLIAPQPGQVNSEWRYITKRGRKFREMGDFQKYKAANLFLPKIFDATLASKARPSFLAGDYDTAVLLAFKEAEVRVRKLGGATSEELGTKLMRKAFNPEDGPLRDPTQLPAEQQAASDLFAGAMGSFKNPGSHRDVNYDDPAEAAELIIFADLLIRMVERRKPKV